MFVETGFNELVGIEEVNHDVVIVMVDVEARMEGKVVVFEGDAAGLGASVEDWGHCERWMRDGEEVALAWEDGDNSFCAASMMPDQEADFGGEAREKSELGDHDPRGFHC